MTRSKILTIVILLVITLYCELALSEPKQNAIPVEVTKAKTKSLNRQITITGSLRASQGITLRPEVAGRITQIYFRSGEIVAAGTPLIELNNSVISAELEQSKAELQLAEQNYDRESDLYKTHTVSKADYDEIVSKLNTAKAKVAQNKAQLDLTLIKAPFTGKLGLSAVSLGDYLNIGQEIVSLEAVDPIEVEFNVPQVYLSNIAVGNNVQIKLDAYPRNLFIGKIYAIDAVMNLSNRTFGVRATIPNKEGKLLPGTFAEVTLNISTGTSAILIPQVAVFYDVGQAFVYKVVNNKAIKTKVTLGERDQENVEVLDGLKADDTVITAGQLNVNDGSQVKVLNPVIGNDK